MVRTQTCYGMDVAPEFGSGVYAITCPPAYLTDDGKTSVDQAPCCMEQSAMLSSPAIYPFSFNCPIPSGPSRLAASPQAGGSGYGQAKPTQQSKKPRLRFSRSTTGCQACRVRRIKCPEGARLTDGRRLPCSRCEAALEEGGKGCWYPAPGRPGEWVPSCTEDITSMDAELASTSGSSRSPPEAVIHLTALSTPPAALSPKQTAQPPTTVDDWWVDLVPAFLLPAIASDAVTRLQGVPIRNTGSSAQGSVVPQSVRGSLVNLPESTEEEDDSVGITAVGIADPPPAASNAFLRFLFASPSPEAPIKTYNLASIPTSARDRSAISYFETKGCNDILVANGRLNWIWAMLFPRIYTFLSTASSPPTAAVCRTRDAKSAIGSYVYHSLLRLSLIHRANTEEDKERAIEMAEEAVEQRKAATQDLLCAKVYYDESEWHTDEYLAAFFVNCMADMLESRRFTIDPEILTQPATHTDSAFSASLRDMIAVYSIFINACAPHSPSNVASLLQGNLTRSALDATGEEWVERFFGVSRKMVNMLVTVNKHILDRSVHLRTSTASSPSRRIAIAQAERLAIELGPLWVIEQGWEELGKSQRVQRGTTVMRMALLMIVLCELLGADLSDPRLQEARLTATELVADTAPHEIAGYGWALSMVAIYTSDPDDRRQLFTVLRNAQDWSFGKGFKGVDEIIHMCWALYDREGTYRNGIAPWREILAAFDRSVYF